MHPPTLSTLPTPQILQSSTLILIRHGQRADGVPSDPWYTHRRPRRRDPPLTAEGHQQAMAAAHALEADNITCAMIHCSPLTRCLQTAAALAQKLNVPVNVIYSLAKPCKYFRTCMSKNIEPELPNEQETLEILRQVYPEVRLFGCTPDDGRSCATTLQSLVQNTMQRTMNAVPGSRESRLSTVVAGHCESQAEMARLCGVRLRRAPVCGRATFSFRVGMSHDMPNFTEPTSSEDIGPSPLVQWNMIESPTAYFQRRHDVLTS